MLCWEPLKSIVFMGRACITFLIYVLFNVIGLDSHMWFLPEWEGKHCGSMTGSLPGINSRNESVLNTTCSIKCTLLFHLLILLASDFITKS